MRLQRIDALRAVSVLLVVLAHSGLRIAPGGMGVTIFFVISGFVITRLLIREHDKVPGFRIKAFFARRVLKIFPPLLAVVIIPSVLLFQVLDLDIKAVLAQLFFVYNWVKMDQGATGVLLGSAVVWSLAIEEQFYIAIACLWFFVVRKTQPVTKIFFVYLGLFLYSTVARVFISVTNSDPHDDTGNLPRIYYGTDCRISSIAIGGLLALLVTQSSETMPALGRRVLNFIMKPQAFYLSLGLIVFSLVIRNESFRDTFRYSIQEFAAVLLIASSLVEKNWPGWVSAVACNRIVQAIGLGSYTIYLTHLTIIGLINTQNWTLFSEKLGIVTLSICATGIGLGIHYLVDAPFEKYRARWRLNQSNSQVAKAT